MTFSRKKVIGALKELSVILLFLIAAIVVALLENVLRNDGRNDAYFYVPTGTRAAFKYTDIKMYDCSWCHRTNNLTRHHIVPQAADPSLRHEFTNIVVLCRDCHFVLGHRCNTRKFNPDVMEIINKYTNCIISAEYYKEKYQ